MVGCGPDAQPEMVPAEVPSELIRTRPYYQSVSGRRLRFSLLGSPGWTTKYSTLAPHPTSESEVQARLMKFPGTHVLSVLQGRGLVSHCELSPWLKSLGIRRCFPVSGRTVTA